MQQQLGVILGANGFRTCGLNSQRPRAHARWMPADSCRAVLGLLKTGLKNPLSSIKNIKTMLANQTHPHPHTQESNNAVFHSRCVMDTLLLLLLYDDIIIWWIRNGNMIQLKGAMSECWQRETEKLLELHWSSSCKKGEKINPFTKTQTFTLTYLKPICRAASVFWIKLIEISAVYG